MFTVIHFVGHKGLLSIEIMESLSPLITGVCTKLSKNANILDQFEKLGFD